MKAPIFPTAAERPLQLARMLGGKSSFGITNVVVGTPNCEKNFASKKIQNMSVDPKSNWIATPVARKADEASMNPQACKRRLGTPRCSHPGQDEIAEDEIAEDDGARRKFRDHPELRCELQQ